MAMVVPAVQWPWPMDGVQDWFEELWQWVGQAANDARDWLWSKIEPVVGPIIGLVTEKVNWLWGQIDPVLKDLDKAVDEFWEWSKTDMWNLLKALPAEVAEALDYVYGEIGEITNQVLGPIWGWVDGSLRWLSDTFKWLREEMGEGWDWIVGSVKAYFADRADALESAVDDVAPKVEQAVADANVGLLDFFFKELPGWFMDTLNWINDRVLTPIWNGLTWLWNWLIDQATNTVEWVGDTIKAQVTAIREDPLGSSMMLLTGAGGLGLAATGICSVAGVKIVGTGIEVGEIGSYVKDFLNPSMITSVTIGTLLGATIGDSMSQWAKNMIRLTLPTVGDCSRMLWRGSITEDGFKKYLGRAGYEDPLISGFLELSKNIPGPSDLITFVVREVITPEDFQKWMGFQGYSLEWARNFWEAHWVLPAFGLLVDAFHRGLISAEERDKYIVWHDYSPTPRPGIAKTDLEIMAKLQKTLIPRVDLRRGWELGELSDSDLEKRYVWLGYEDDAPLMAAIQKRVALESEIGKLRDNAKTDFVKGYITEEQLRGDLLAIGYSDQLTDYHVADAVSDRDRKQKDLLVDFYVDGWVKDLVPSEEDLRDYLSQVIPQKDVVELIISRAYVAKYRKPKVPVVKIERLEADVLALERDVAEQEDRVRAAESELTEAQTIQKETLDTYDTEIAAAEAELAVERARPVPTVALERNVVELERRVAAQLAEVESLESELREARVIQAETLDTYDTQIRLLEEDIAALR